jgi:antitoxin ParD1/3/4
LVLPQESPSRKPNDAEGGLSVEFGADMDKVTIRLPAKYLKRLDFLVSVDDFPSRSEAIRTAVRDLLYNRLEYVIEKQKQALKADLLDAEMENIQKQYLTR